MMPRPAPAHSVVMMLDTMSSRAQGQHQAIPEDQQRSEYRNLIDALVEECPDGKGQAYESAIHDTLRVLNNNEVSPFDDACERATFHGFMGRLKTDWAWPG